MRRRGPSHAHPCRPADRGSALPLVLVFVVVIGALIAALLAQAQTNFRTTGVTRNNQDKVYAANSALEYATQMLRADPTLCSTSGPGATPSGNWTGVPQLGGRSVNISCTPTSGSSAGPGGWAVFTTGTTGNTISITCAGTCSSAAKRIVGPVYNGAGWGLGDILTVQDGFVVQRPSGASCPAQPANLRFNPTGLNSYRCGTPSPDPPPAPWTLSELMPAVPATAPAATNSTNCRVFSPGRYTSANPLTLSSSGENYLKSGVYLLDNTTMTLPWNATVVAGRPNNGDTAAVPLTGNCLAAQSSDAPASGVNGVVFLLSGGNSGIVADTLFGFATFAKFEINAYRPDPASIRAPISIYQLTSAEASARSLSNPNNFPSNALNVFDFSGGFGSYDVRVSVRGAVYAPQSAVNLTVSDTLPQPLGGGLVAKSFSMSVGYFSGSTADFGVNNGQRSQQRTVQVNVSVLPKAGVTEKPILGVASVVISNDSAHSISIASWRINEDTNTATPT